MTVHLKTLITVIIILLPGPVTMAGNWKLAQLRDTSLVVSVYSAANNTSMTVGTIWNDEFFFCEPVNAEWLNVRTTKPIWGVHTKKQDPVG